MRAFNGVKARLAQEFSGFMGSAKAFRDRYEPKEQKQYHRYYSAEVIRSIRLRMLNASEGIERPKTLPPIIDARMAKGGVGKTTITGNIASCMALLGHRVLLIDGDPQASLTGLFGIKWMASDITHIGELMKRCSRGEPIRVEQAIRPIYSGGMLDLIPADITMADDSWLMGSINREHAFTRLIEQEINFFSQYDVIVIDSAPGSSLLTTTFMVASQTLLTVVSPEGQSLAALGVLASNVHELNAAFAKQGFKLDVHIVVNRYNQSKAPHNQSLATLLAKYPDKIDDTIVREFIGFLRETDPENVEENGPVLEKEPNSVGARDIIDLTKSLIKRYDVRLADVTATTMIATA